MATVVKSMSVLGIEGFCIEVEATTIKGQQERFKEEAYVNCNAQMTTSMIQKLLYLVRMY